jgi:porin
VAPLSPSTRLCQVALLGLAVALACHPLGAAENSGANSSAAPTEDKSGGKEGDKSSDKAANRSENPPEAKEESKPPDPCDPQKQLVSFDLRNHLCKSGVKLSITETSEVLNNLTGGVRQGAIYEGLTDLNLGIDLRPTLHWRGNIFARAYQIHGRGLTANNLDNLNFASSIEAERTTRLSELWYEQHFDYWRLRIGQQSIGTEFFNPESARLFVNGTLGWPTQPSLDLPSGGPGYPLGTPAVRLRVDPEEGWTYFLAVFNGDPTGAGVGGSQLRDASGTAFRTSDGAWVLSEIRYNPDNSDKHGTYRFGGWWNSERFRDLHLDQNGIPLASPASNGKPFRHDGDYSFYVNIDQPLLYDEKEHTSFAVFARAGIVPSDRNLNDIYADAGILYKGPFGRADDQTGIAVAYVHIGDAARAFDADVQRLTGQFHPIRSGETVLELTYRFQLTGWWQLQPDFQYVFNPGGGIANPIAPTRRIGDATIVGLRMSITF